MNESIAFSVRLSLQVALMSTIIVAILGTVVAYFLARREFPGRAALDLAATLPLILPPTVTGYYLITLLGRRGLLGGPLYEYTGFTFVFNWWGAVVAAVVISFPLMVKTAKAALESVDEDMVKISYTLGKSEMETAFKVIFPLARKGLLAGVALAFARALGEFGATLMLAGNIPGRTNIMPIAIYSAVSAGEMNRANLMVILMTAVSVLSLYLVHRLGSARW